jgi:hypothetical protein
MLDELMQRFGQIPGAKVGHGPEHPESPDPSTAERLEEFLASYHSLQADQSYCDFLRRYGGAYIENHDATLIIDIFGFSEVSTDIVEMEGPVVNKDGYLIYAQCIYYIMSGNELRGTQEHDFAFDMTGARRPGIYRLYGSSEHLHNQFEWQHESFASWLAYLMDHDARLSPPSAN